MTIDNFIRKIENKRFINIRYENKEIFIDFIATDLIQINEKIIEDVIKIIITKNKVMGVYCDYKEGRTLEYSIEEKNIKKILCAREKLIIRKRNKIKKIFDLNIKFGMSLEYNTDFFKELKEHLDYYHGTVEVTPMTHDLNTEINIKDDDEDNFIYQDVIESVIMCFTNIDFKKEYSESNLFSDDVEQFKKEIEGDKDD